jgi:hypothetical protein
MNQIISKLKKESCTDNPQIGTLHQDNWEHIVYELKVHNLFFDFIRK